MTNVKTDDLREVRDSFPRGSRKRVTTREVDLPAFEEL
jgi:hypothetical protein